MDWPASRKSPVRFHLLLALVLALLVTVGVWWLLGQHNAWLWWLASWLIAVNVVAFALYGFDKSRSRSGGRRIPELVLHILAGLGGSLGALLGMQAFRHKTIKGTFRVWFWAIVVLQVALLGWILKMMWWT